MSVDNSLSDITVDVDAKFSHDVLQDLFSIEATVEDDKYTIYLDVKCFSLILSMFILTCVFTIE